MLKYANFLLILTIIFAKNRNDYINLNQIEMRTDTSLLKAKFMNNLAEYNELNTPIHNVQHLNLV
jgi:hypothetical protein